MDPSAEDTDDMMGCHDARNQKRFLFSRDIRSYKNGVHIGKHCAPWGDNAFLHNATFTIEKRWFAANDNIVSIEIRNTDAPHKTYLIDKEFFQGWTDSDALMKCFEFKV
jgi:hypothetical protein